MWRALLLLLLVAGACSLDIVNARDRPGKPTYSTYLHKVQGFFKNATAANRMPI